MYYVLQEDYHETHVFVGNIPKEIKKQYQLLEGVSRREDWPDNVVFKFSENRPKGLVLTDWLDNSSNWLLISSRFKTILEEFKQENIEYLPVTIINHKGRTASKNYWIGNFTVLIEAVDREHSIFRDDPVDEGEISSFNKLVLQNQTITSGPVIFRLKEQPMLVLAREDLVQRIGKEGLNGMKFKATDQFKTLDPDD